MRAPLITGKDRLSWAVGELLLASLVEKNLNVSKDKWTDLEFPQFRTEVDNGPLATFPTSGFPLLRFKGSIGALNAPRGQESELGITL